MRVDQPIFLRIDTAKGVPCLQGASGDAVVSSLLAGSSDGWFDLLGFVVLPNEVQLLMIPRNKTIQDFLPSFEKAVCAALDNAPLVFDTDYYREKLDFGEEFQQRLHWMHSAPVRSRLATRSDAYPYSSANQRYSCYLKTQAIN